MHNIQVLESSKVEDQFLNWIIEQIRVLSGCRSLAVNLSSRFKT